MKVTMKGFEAQHARFNRKRGVIAPRHRGKRSRESYKPFEGGSKQ